MSAARIAALLARATHAGTPQEEARTAAMVACGMIQASGGYAPPTIASAGVDLAVAESRIATLDAQLATERAALAAAKELIVELRKTCALWVECDATLRERMAAIAALAGGTVPAGAFAACDAPLPSPSVPAVPPAPTSRPRIAKAWRRFAAPKAMLAKFAGRCAECGCTIEPGAKILYDGNSRNAWHAACDVAA
jgi:hypothetical protein